MHMLVNCWKKIIEGKLDEGLSSQFIIYLFSSKVFTIIFLFHRNHISLKIKVMMEEIVK